MMVPEMSMDPALLPIDGREHAWQRSGITRRLYKIGVLGVKIKRNSGLLQKNNSYN